MTKLKTIALSFLFIFTIPLHAEGPNYGMCGERPGMINRLFTDAEKIRIKCIEDAYQANKEKVRKEIEDLYAMNTKLDAELKKSAIKINYNMVQCSPKYGEPKRAPSLIKRCEEIIVAKTAVISRINELNGWDAKPVAKNLKTKNSEVSPPCPSKEKLKEMQVARMFNRKLFVTWERCVTLNPEGYFQ